MPASILGEVDDLSRCSALVAQVPGDNGGVPYVCTACGHSWS
ncbi:hypothetical protein ACIRL0_09975 [Streptomyces sp. NPDC102365]